MSELLSILPRAIAVSPVCSSRQVDALKVAIVCMPFASVATPSIQVGLITGVARQAGFTADAFHLSLNLAARIGSARYEALCGHRGHMTGEWLCSVAAFGPVDTSDDDSYFSAFSQETNWAKRELDLGAKELSHLRHETIPSYIDDCMSATDWGSYGVIGFTSTFQQNVASLALARRIKERYPWVNIVFGGANMEDVMGAEYMRAFSFIDYVVVGEGDVVFPELLRAIAADADRNISGIVRRSDANIVFTGQAAPVRDLDSLPVPDYEEFFRRAHALGLPPSGRLPFESSRGCWWGRKNHCTFCGLNGLGMGFRMKSADRVLLELDELGRRHQIYAFDATDNILFPQYVSRVFGKIADDKTDLEFFYEVKANLDREQLRTLHRGGVRRVQPGIESMSTHILALMKKGTTMLQNACFLKWCRYYGIRASWNLLCGFPGETSTDYARQLEVLRLLSHLEPPSGLSRIWLERFSPYFVQRDVFPIHDVKPEASYRFVYPHHVDLEKIAYFFDYAMDNVTPNEDLFATDDWVNEWRGRWHSGTTTESLEYRKTNDCIILDDRRGSKSALRYVFDGPLGIAYEHCGDTARTVADVALRLNELAPAREYSDSEIRGALEEFCSAGLMLTEDGQYLSLALPSNRNW